MSHAYVILDVSPAAFAEIYEKLEQIYSDQLHDTAEGMVIDMHGIALRSEDDPYAA